MGPRAGKPLVEISEEVITQHFEGSETYRFSGCIDIRKLKQDLGVDPGSFVAY